MPGNNLSDMAFQPKTKGYSYSANNSPSKNNNNVYLISGIILLIVILLAVFLYLNNSGNIKTQNINTNYQTKTPTSQTVKSGLATKEQIEVYQTYVKQKGFADASSYSADSKDWSVEGLYAGYENNTVNVVTTKGLVEFPISQATSFETIVIVKGPKEEGGGSFKTEGSYKLDKFLQTVAMGKFLQIYYTQLSSANIIATRVIYYPDLK